MKDIFGEDEKTKFNKGKVAKVAALVVLSREKILFLNVPNLNG